MRMIRPRRPQCVEARQNWGGLLMQVVSTVTKLVAVVMRLLCAVASDAYSLFFSVRR